LLDKDQALDYGEVINNLEREGLKTPDIIKKIRIAITGIMLLMFGLSLIGVFFVGLFLYGSFNSLA